MDYERIHNPQTGIISPSKLRMKLMGSPNRRKKDASNTNSSRTSPARLDHSELLAFATQHYCFPNMGFVDSEEEGSRSESVNENLDYDSNASSSSFEFHKGERQRAANTRPMPRSYKWNDAEKWIVNMNNKQSHYPKCQNRIAVLSLLRPAPAPAPPQSNSFIKDIIPIKTGPDDSAGNPSVREVSMRDMGTEMTPLPSQEPSRTSTPVGATTPLPTTPNSSLPSTPRKKDAKETEMELSEQDAKLKTRREIVALGVQLGKMNIAAWASEYEQERSVSDGTKEDLERAEYEKRAAAWEEAQNSKDDAWFKREEIKIEAWESEQKLKLEEEMRRIEAKVEEMRAHAQAKMMKKIAMARKRSDERRMAAEARKSRRAETTAAQADTIRLTGRIPSSRYMCCGLF